MDEVKLKEKISKMTLNEKLLEMTQYDYSELGFDAVGEATGITYSSGLPKEELRSLGSVLNIPCGEEVKRFRAFRKQSGIKEPVVIMRDVIHGYRTVYPVPIAMACSFDMPLIELCAKMAAEEAKLDGIDVTFSPMVDLSRDARWGRVMEGAGEDPYLIGEVGKAFIRGYHKGGIACCVKHIAAYGAAESGRDYNTTDLSEYMLREYYLKPYVECLKESPESVMSAFNIINGIPVAADEWLLNKLLREEWRFDGVLISDWGSIGQLKNHGVAENDEECAFAAIKTKHDIEMCTSSFRKYLPRLIERGDIKESAIDEAVLRVLKLKNKLGTYENPDRFTDEKKRDEVCLSKEHRAIARKAAEDSFVLLKNDGTLPLVENSSVGFVGPFFDTRDIIGNWSACGKTEEAVSIKSGVEKLLNRKIESVLGCGSGLLENDESGIEEAVSYAKKHDVIVVCVGEPSINSGESHSRADLRLPLVQRKLIERLSSLKKPLISVVFGGRPQVLTDIEKLASSILYVWQPGIEGGNAIARMLYGKAMPSAKTVMSFPRSVGQLPLYYNCFNTGHPKENDIVSDTVNYGSGYDDEFNSPLYPFGFGLSYTRYEYSDLKLSDTVLNRNGKITAEVCVKNVGIFDGKEVVQWYIRDKVASRVRPVKELKGFEKVFIKRGESKTITFDINEEKLAFYTASKEVKAEKGEFTLFVGGNSRDCISIDFKLK